VCLRNSQEARKVEQSEHRTGGELSQSGRPWREATGEACERQRGRLCGKGHGRGHRMGDRETTQGHSQNVPFSPGHLELTQGSEMI
jgi:hypothetical protein